MAVAEKIAELREAEVNKMKEKVKHMQVSYNKLQIFFFKVAYFVMIWEKTYKYICFQYPSTGIAAAAEGGAGPAGGDHEGEVHAAGQDGETHRQVRHRCYL